MKLLPEFALIHDIFEGSPREVRFAIAYLHKRLLSDGLVRNLHGGAWAQMLRERTKDETLAVEVRKLITELIEGLFKDNRLLSCPRRSSTAPESATAWCQEALAGHRADPLDAIIAGAATAQACSDKVVHSLDELPDLNGNFEPVRSLRVRQQTVEYLQHLQGVLDHAGRVCFIDSFLGEPADYSEFPKLILAMRKRSPQPRIELHRAQKYDGKEIRKESEWRARFRDWDQQFSAAGQRVKMFIWGKFHGRYLLSDLVSLELGWGFRTSKDASAVVDWARLSREHAEKRDREFDENFPKDHLACLVCNPFYIGNK